MSILARVAWTLLFCGSLQLGLRLWAKLGGKDKAGLVVLADVLLSAFLTLAFVGVLTWIWTA